MMGNNSIKIIADASETRSGIIKLLQALPGYEIEVRSLDCGDYLVGEDCVVERKANADLFASILDGRFISQCQLMTEAYGRVIYLVEGGVHDTPHGFSKESIYGALSYISVLCGASLIPSANVKESASLIATMARHSQHGLGYHPPLRVQKPKDPIAAKLYVLEGLPAMGGSKARDVLAHFGTVGAALSATREEWLQIPGMGKATVEKIWTILHGI